MLVLCFLSAQGDAQQVWSVRRSTNDRDHDLVNALMDRQRFDEAIALCQRASGSDREGDESARWAIQHSRVLMSRQWGSDRFEESDIESASRPVMELLSAYPEHQRKWALSAQAWMVRRGAAVHRVLRAAVSADDSPDRDEATKILLRVTTDLESLITSVAETRSLMERSTDDRPVALLADLARLQQELQVESVALSLLQSELFAPGSEDLIAAATRAEEFADQAIARLPSDTKAREEVERLRVEAILRTEQYDRADVEMSKLLKVVDPLLDPRWSALQIRMDLAQDRLPQATERLNEYYGERPESAPHSTDMDLARLELLLRTDPGQSLGDWLRAIESRGGAYARRRAEAIAIALVGRSSPMRPPILDPSIIAAQGHDYLRRGDPVRAGEMLAAAAEAETDPERALERATQAAAAFQQAERYREATAVLAETSLANPTAQQACAAHLQAAMFVATHDPHAVEKLESMLRLNLEQWPSATPSTAARGWLRKLLVGQQRLIEAAEIVTSVLPEQVTPSDLELLESQWTIARDQVDPAPAAVEVSRRFLAAFQPLLGNVIAAQRYPWLVALLVDRTSLAGIELPANAQADLFAMALIAYRAKGTSSESLWAPPPERIHQATQRLMIDGRQNPSLRPSIADVLEKWDPIGDPSFERVERLLWAGKTDESTKVLRQLIRAEAASIDVARRAARLLESSDQAEALNEAVQLWDQLAAGTTQASPLWHEAKLASCAALTRAKRADESQRRARYILLTVPSLDENLRQQYEAYAR